MELVWNFGILTFFCETFWGDQKHWNLCQYLVSVSCGTCIFFVNDHLPIIMLFLYYWYQAIHCVSSFNCIWFIDGDWISDSQFIGCFEWTSPWSFFFFSFVSVTVFHASILILDWEIYIPNSRWERKQKHLRFGCKSLFVFYSMF